MANFQIEYFSSSLQRQVQVHFLLPNDVLPEMQQGNSHYQRPAKTLVLLHGYSGGNQDWLFDSSIRELSVNYNLAVILPSGENSFYLDQPPRKFGQFVGEELPRFVCDTFHLSTDREDIWIAGFSMGGFGAVRNGLKYNKTFGKIGGLAPALIINTIAGKEEGYQNEIADYNYYVQTFGPLDKLLESEHNPEYLVRSLLESGETVPPIFMACGTEDFLLDTNRDFANTLHDMNVDITYAEVQGHQHDWQFVNGQMEAMIQWMLK